MTHQVIVTQRAKLPRKISLTSDALDINLTHEAGSFCRFDEKTASYPSACVRYLRIPFPVIDHLCQLP